MTKQLIFHAEQARTFSDKKGAAKAIKRDLGKHTDTHGDVLLATGTEIQQTPDGRYGVVVFCDITPATAEKVVGPELAGYVIQAELDAEPTRRMAPAPAPRKPGKRKTGEITVAPMAKAIPARAESKQQKMIDALATGCVWDGTKTFALKDDSTIVGQVSKVGGCTMDSLRAVCKKKDGTPWDDNSIRSGLYYDVHQKGYGVTTRLVGDVAYYMLVLPEGYDAPMESRKPKTRNNTCTAQPRGVT